MPLANATPIHAILPSSDSLQNGKSIGSKVSNAGKGNTYPAAKEKPGLKEGEARDEEKRALL